MNKAFLITGFALISFLGYGQTHTLISQQEAEKILGRPAHLSANSTETRDHIIKTQNGFFGFDKRSVRKNFIFTDQHS
jgi:hypothetical protein